LSNLQWCALVLLMVGCATSQLASETSCDTSATASIFAVPIEGILICIALSILSASAGITTEWIMKKSNLKNDPLQRQNMHLYFFGIIFNFLGYWFSNDSKGSFFEGYNFVTLLVVMSYSFSGLIVSVIMKYADNMVKIYAVAVSMALTMILSILLFPDFQPTLQLLFGIIIITISILQYFDLLSTDTSTNKTTTNATSASPAPSKSNLNSVAEDSEPIQVSVHSKSSDVPQESKSSILTEAKES